MWLGTLCTPGRKGSREGCEGGSGNGNGNGKGGGLLKWEGKCDGRGMGRKRERGEVRRRLKVQGGGEARGGRCSQPCTE